MTTLASTPHQSPRSTPSTSSDYEDAAATWEHNEDTRNPAMKRQAAVDWLSEAFARLSLQAELERERRKCTFEDENNAKNVYESKNGEIGSSASTVMPTPTIKVTPPDAIEAACAVVVVPVTSTAAATEGGVCALV
jgi:hypothetical protein